VKEHPLFVQRLLKPLDGLLEELEVSGLGDPSIPIKLFFSFDEVSNIIDGKNRTMLNCLRKVIRFLSEKPIWAFVLSTKTPMGFTTPAAGAEALLQLSERKLERVAPFYTFAFDLEANRKFKVDRRKQLEKSLDTFSTREHMISFGRPLWNIYRTSPYSDIRELALIKLLGGVHGGVVYSPRDLNHVLAMLSVRVCLDPCLQTSRAIEMASSAVDSHLRVIMQMNPDYRLVKTASPPEPILAEAAAFGLRAKHREQNPWVSTLKVLFTELLSGGLVDKGTAGELGTRVLPIMARDRLFDSVTGNDGPIYANHFKVSEFLGSLFQPQYMALLGLQSAHNFLAGRMNFTHFACTDKHVRSTEMRGLLHTLLMTQAALQSCHDQEFWDLLIPVYFGPPDKPFNLDQVSALFIQVKNRKRTLSQKLTKEGWGRCFDWNEAKVPVLFLQLELEVKNPKQHFKNIMSEFPEVHAGRVIGFSKENYRDPQGGDDSRYWIQQLLQPSPTSLGVQQNNQDQVLRFNQLTPETCFFGYREGKKRELGDDGGVVQENIKKQKTGHEE